MGAWRFRAADPRYISLSLIEQTDRFYFGPDDVLRAICGMELGVCRRVDKNPREGERWAVIRKKYKWRMCKIRNFREGIR
jgi:hypothetical protein